MYILRENDIIYFRRSTTKTRSQAQPLLLFPDLRGVETGSKFAAIVDQESQATRIIYCFTIVVISITAEL